jgi:enolase
MTEIVDIIAREDPRQPGQSDGRGRRVDSRGNPTCHSRRRRLWPRRRAVGRLDRRSRSRSKSATATRPLWGGKGVLKAVDAVNGEIFDALSGVDAEDQRRIDRLMIDAGRHAEQGRLGANAILGVSLATAKAAAESAGLPLYKYVGGVSARVLPTADDEHHQRRRPRRQSDRHPGIHDPADRRAESFSEALRMGSEIFHGLKKALKDAGHNTNVGDEGGFAPTSARPKTPWPSSSRRGEAAGYKAGEDFVLGLDVAATEFFKNGKYELEGEGKSLDPEGMVDYLADLADKFPILSIEDGMSEDDFEGWKLLTDAWARRSSWSATICSSPTPSACRWAWTRAWPTRS